MNVNWHLGFLVFYSLAVASCVSGSKLSSKCMTSGYTSECALELRTERSENDFEEFIEKFNSWCAGGKISCQDVEIDTENTPDSFKTSKDGSSLFIWPGTKKKYRLFFVTGK